MDTEKKQIGVHFGALSKPLSKQLAGQGYMFDRNDVDHFEKDIEAHNRLRIRGYITDSASTKVTQKLYKAIVDHVCKQNKLHRLKK